MAISNFTELYVDELRDLYSAEKQLVAALPEIAKAIQSPDLQQAVYGHLEQTRHHVERLDSIFNDLGEKPSGRFCKGMDGLLKEGSDVVNQMDMGALRDAAIICGAQKIEHYEMAGYGTAKAFAKLLGRNGHIEILQSTLNEESEADHTLTDIAEGSVNEAAVTEGVNNTATWTRAD